MTLIPSTPLPVVLGRAAACLASAVCLAVPRLKAADAAAPADSARPVVLIKTSQGDIRLELWPQAAPKTVQNFIELAEGEKEWTDPATGEQVKRPFYDGLTFHRVIPDFMIQGGCPKGDGTGGPGYTFEDEINAKGLGLDAIKAMNGMTTHPWLLVRNYEQFNAVVVRPIVKELGISDEEQLKERIQEVQAKFPEITLRYVLEGMGYQYNDDLEPVKPLRGVIAMANSGPATNGSQFFINVGDTPHLTGKHTVFGKVIEGMDVVDAISKVETGEGSKPVESVVIQSIRRVEPGKN